MDQSNEAQRERPRWPAPAEFARMSSSMKLTVIAILRAQMSARKALAAAAVSVKPPQPDEN